MSSNTGLIVLEDPALLRELARIIYRQEVEITQNIKFGSESERAKYLRDCKSNYDTILTTLDAGLDLKEEFKDDPTKETIAHAIHEYVIKLINSSLQVFKNYSLRTEYLAKVGAHATEMIASLVKLNPADMDDVAKLAKSAAFYRDTMDKFLKESQSMHSTAFSRWIKNTGMSFSDLVKKYMIELGYAGKFEALDDVQKLKVYNKIILASGRGSVLAGAIDTALAVGGVAVLILSLGTMVWDIFTAENPLETATRDALMIAAGIAGAAFGELVAAALASAAAGKGVMLGSTVLAGVSFITGVAGGFVLSAVAGALVALIFATGGTTEPVDITAGHVFFVAPSLPDGAALARQIAHNNQL